MCETEVPSSSQSPSVPDAHAGLNLQAIRAAIPPECFEISLSKSMFYLFQDYALLALLYSIRAFLLPGLFEGPGTVGVLMRVLWWNCVGFELWALFVVGHDCGHGVFSKNSLVNFIVGHVAHTPLLVPFWGWRQSHHAHHSYHNDLVRDKAWKPIEKSHYELWASSVLPGWLYRVFRFTPLMFLMFPYYLVAPTGELSYGSHYNPFNREIFPNTTDSAKGAVGTVSILAFLWGVYRVCAAYSGLTTVGGVLGVMADWYLMPYMIFTAWLSFTTYMHHSSPDSVFFRSNTEVNKWTFAKGAETTIDRSFGPVLDYLMHHIGTHFLHHCFFTSLPHYSLQKATEAAAPVAGAFFKKDDRNPFVAYFQDRRHCIVVPDTGSKITFIKDKKHL